MTHRELYTSTSNGSDVYKAVHSNVMKRLACISRQTSVANRACREGSKRPRLFGERFRSITRVGELLRRHVRMATLDR